MQEGEKEKRGTEMAGKTTHQWKKSSFRSVEADYKEI